ncbi:hypothetical protein [Nocardia wallacei]|uniref:hypothetical protein n=1 Tax=Nocardia wallacei TaxID=480035 RepID=UPI00245713A5|nr:hypothetical protein [Nocardia wallacei]
MARHRRYTPHAPRPFVEYRTFIEHVTVSACVAAISVVMVVALGHVAGVVPVFWIRVYGWVALSTPVAAAVAAAVWCVIDAAGDHRAARRYRRPSGGRS